MVPSEVLVRTSYLIGIYRALNILFPNSAQADAWIRRPNRAPGFGGRSTLECSLDGGIAEFHAVRAYLDSQLGGEPT